MATLTERYQTEISLGGVTYKVVHTKSTAGLTDLFDRVIGVTSSAYQTLLSTGTDDGDTLTDIDFLYIENLDSTNFVTIGFQVASGDTYFERLVAGAKMVKASRYYDVNTSGTTSPTMAQWTTVLAKADTAEVSLRVVAAD